MAETQPAPQTQQPITTDGSLVEAQEALLKLLDSEEEAPEQEEVEATEEEESQPVEEGDSLEEDVEEEESEEEEYSEDTDNRAPEGEDLVYAVNVNGEEQEVTLDELMKGYSRQSDYTKKTQEVSEQRKEIEGLKNQYQSEVDQIQTERVQYVQALQSLLENSMQSLDEFANINWEQLKNEDPIEFVTKKEEFRDKQEKLQQMQQNQQMVQQRQMEENRKLHKEAVESETVALVGKLPEWGDAQKKPKIAKQVKEYALSQGFTAEEIKGLVDHRSILVLLKASKYDALSNSDVKAKKLKNKPRVVRAGTGVRGSDSTRSQRKQKMKRLQQSGHVDDAASLLEDMFNS